tara:strand:+ start:1752 stop:1964 length:213 start_codon:yes stop_codon:yes gene_type:complete
MGVFTLSHKMAKIQKVFAVKKRVRSWRYIQSHGIHSRDRKQSALKGTKKRKTRKCSIEKVQAKLKNWGVE